MIEKHKTDYLRAKESGDKNQLEFFSRLFAFGKGVGRTAKPAEKPFSFDDFPFTEEHVYDPDSFTEDYSSLHEQEFDSDFLQVLKQLFFGNLNLHDLGQLEGDLNVSNQELSDIDEIEYCINITSLDLSHNQLSNIYTLQFLDRLTSLDLSHNPIHDIDLLKNLDSLETLYLENNDLESVEILTAQPSLKFVTLYGNPLHDTDIVEELKKRGVIVICEKQLYSLSQLEGAIENLSRFLM